MKIIKSLLAIGLILCTSEIFGQELPATYQAMLNEFVTNFKTIKSGNTIQQGKNVLSVINDNKIALRIDHQKKIKNLTFITKLDAENKLVWVPANPITIDMVNKYEETLTEIFDSMLKLSQKKAKE
jgi:hypothetical protein